MTKKIINLTADDISGLKRIGISHILVETSPSGEVLREIGFDSDNNPLYKYPGDGKFGKFGLLDNQIIKESESNSEDYNFDDIFSSLR